MLVGGYVWRATDHCQCWDTPPLVPRRIVLAISIAIHSTGKQIQDQWHNIVHLQFKSLDSPVLPRFSPKKSDPMPQIAPKGHGVCDPGKWWAGGWHAPARGHGIPWGSLGEFTQQTWDFDGFRWKIKNWNQVFLTWGLMQKGGISWTRMGLGKCRPSQSSIERWPWSGSAAGMHGMDGVNGVPISACVSHGVPWCPMVSPCPPWRIDVFQHPSADCSASSTAWPSWKIIGVIHSSMKKHKGFFLCHQYFQKHPMSRKYHLFIISCCYLQMWSDPVIIRFWLVFWIPTLSVSLPICLG